MQSRHGSFLVTGNHEYYAGAHAWIDEFRRIGITVLLNEHVLIEHDGAHAVLAGVTDFTAGGFDPAHRSDPVQALAGRRATSARRSCSRTSRAARKRRTGPAFTVQLSGHTHGGQFRHGHRSRLQQPVIGGLSRFGDPGSIRAAAPDTGAAEPFRRAVRRSR